MVRSSLSAFLALGMCAAAVHGGDLQVRTIASKALDREVKINVLLPDGYGENAERRYPTVYLLHGYGGDYTEWERVGIVEEAKGVPAIIAMPEGDQSFYINQHGKPTERWEDYIVEEVVGFVEKNYRTAAGRKGRAVSGLSMGGYGAMMLGLRHPELFGSIASHSGALGVPGPVGGDGGIAERLNEIYGPADSQEREKYNLVKLARELPKAHRPDIYIDCGSSDFLLNANRDFVAELSGLKATYEYREVPGAHNFEYWKRNVRYSLEHQLAALEKAAATLGTDGSGGEDSFLSGLWEVTSAMPNSDEERTYEMVITQKGTKLLAVSKIGEREFETEGKFEGAEFVLRADRERDGQKFSVIVEALLEGDARLVGKWKVLNGEGEERFNEKWSAVLKERRGRPKSALSSLAGDWSLLVDLAGNEIDYVLKLENDGGKLKAIFVSPRSGPHPCKKASFEKGALRMEMEREFQGEAITFIYEGKLIDGKLAGRYEVKGYEDEFGGEWSGTRKKKEAAKEGE